MKTAMTDAGLKRLAVVLWSIIGVIALVSVALGRIGWANDRVSAVLMLMALPAMIGGVIGYILGRSCK